MSLSMLKNPMVEEQEVGDVDMDDGESSDRLMD